METRFCRRLLTFSTHCIEHKYCWIVTFSEEVIGSLSLSYQVASLAIARLGYSDAEKTLNPKNHDRLL
jgi:hypothetical protein